MKQRDYDPDFSFLVTNRRRAARLQLLGYAFIIFMVVALISAIVAGINHFLRFL